MLNHSTRLSITGEVNSLIAVLTKGDKWYAHQAEAKIRGVLYDVWDAKLRFALRDLREITSRFGAPKVSEIDEVLAIFKKHLAGNAITDHLGDVRKALASAFTRGKEEADRDYKTALKGSRVKKAETEEVPTPELPQGLLYGITESHALSALDKFVRLSVGGFWEDELTEVMRNDLTQFFEGDLTREGFADHLQQLIDDRFKTTGTKSLPRNYFDIVAENAIVTTRTAAKVFRGIELGATGYRLLNPNDGRTSPICAALTSGNIIYPFDAAVDEVNAIITAESLDDLKEKAPFHRSSASGGRVTPPFHVKCRTAIALVFAGLND